MKDSQHSSQKNNFKLRISGFFQKLFFYKKLTRKKGSSGPSKSKKIVAHAHFFDVVVILLLLNIAATAVVVFYIQKIKSYTLPPAKYHYIKINSIPLPGDLSSINASAAAYVVYDPTTRTVVAGKNQLLRFSPASTAKVMTAILAVEHYKLADFLTVPSDIYIVQGSKMNLSPGEEVSVENLLYGMMLPSGNDAAYTLAYYYPGGINGFVRAMNRKVKELQLENTHFVDPAGYEDGNYTTAEELARLGGYALQKAELAKIVRTRSISVTNRAGTHRFLLNNLNTLLQYEDVVGIKTGFTNEAGGVLLTAINKKGKLFIVAVLKSQDRFSDTWDIMQFIREKVAFSFPKEN
jgi:D-alanyl-D-alanine carboxypeptidase